MSFDDRLRDALRQATESHPLDADGALHSVKARGASVTDATSDDAVVPVALEDIAVPGRRRVRAQRLVAAAAALVVLAAGIAIPFALRDRSHDTARKVDIHTPKKSTTKSGNSRIALNAVAAAVNATTASGSFRVSYTLDEMPGTAPTTTTCAHISVHVVQRQGDSQALIPSDGTPATTCFPGGSVHSVSTTGTATVNVDPFAMVAVSNVSTFGAVTVRVDDTNYWETTGSNMTPPAGSVPGTALSNFASLVESTLGPREGAEAMMGLASPTGYLSITRAAITGATETGTGTVNGEPVTNYRVTVDPARLAGVPGLSPEELTTINAALALLRSEGFTGNTTDVSVNAAGYVVHTTSVNNFADGGTVSSDDTFSDFGCAGTVEIPGRHLGSVCHETTSVSTTTPKYPAIVSGPGPEGGTGRNSATVSGPEGPITTGYSSGAPTGPTG